MIVQKYNLNTIPNGVLPIVCVSQFDKETRQIEFSVYENGEVYDLTGSNAKVKSSFFEEDCIVDETVSFVIKENMTQEDKDIICEIVFDNSLGSLNFILRVTKTV